MQIPVGRPASPVTDQAVTIDPVTAPGLVLDPVIITQSRIRPLSPPLGCYPLRPFRLYNNVQPAAPAKAPGQTFGSGIDNTDRLGTGQQLERALIETEIILHCGARFAGRCHPL